MTVRVTVRGQRRASAQLKLLPREKIRDVGKALFVAGDMIKAEAQVSITTGAVSGANHVPSRPGEPPNEDTGDLRRSIKVVQTGPLSVRVVAGGDGAPYAPFLEFGTSRMLARPFMGPAARKRKDEAVAIVRRAVG